MKGNGKRRTFEALLRAQVYLLRLRDLFEEVLDDHSVVVAHLAAFCRQSVVRGRKRDIVPGRNLDVEVTLNDIHI